MTEMTLDARAQEILKGIITGFVLTGEPVGSRTIAKLSREGLSPASVRNVMADLEEMGLLSQPHTSAGRVPTDKGYRYYVDSLLKVGRPAARDRALIDESLVRTGGEFSEAMEAIPRLLSRLTSQVGYFLTPPLSDAVLKHIEFVRLHDRRVLVVFVDAAEVVSHRLLDLREDLSQEDLNRAGRYLVQEFAGLTLQQIRARLVRLMAEEKATFDRMLRDAVTLGTQYLDAEAGERKVVVEGTVNLLKHPEFSADVDTMRRLFQTFEEKHRLVTLLDRCLDASGPKVLIGSENADPALGSLALVASPYRLADGGTGWLGVLGPTRMEYERAVALVDYISRVFSSLLTRPSA
ncbi:MAG TPA: heat-inducible transcriptional repressor HrcA [Candidatus Polarisedimenticolia bacterium]|nr:heat-inducible transcriptional repressor HrcA [Candidatus Polarisedimenticolia bacterium]